MKRIQYLLFAFYYWFLDILFTFVPKSWRYKCIADDVVLITGAGSGLGRLLALKLSKLALHLVLWDISEETVKETARLVTTTGGHCSFYVVDVSDSREVNCFAEKVRKEVGKVNILVNNAGIVCGKLLMDLTDNEIVKTFNVNALSHYWTCKAFLPDMMKANSGHVVSIASVASYSGLSKLSDYCGSKGAVAMFFESLVLETKDAGFDNINFTLVCPYLMSTGMFEGAKSTLFPTLNPNEVAERIVEGILTNEEFVVLPKILRFLIALRSITPVKTQYMLYRFVGYETLMSSFAAKSC